MGGGGGGGVVHVGPDFFFYSYLLNAAVKELMMLCVAACCNGNYLYLVSSVFRTARTLQGHHHHCPYLCGVCGGLQALSRLRGKSQRKGGHVVLMFNPHCVKVCVHHNYQIQTKCLMGSVMCCEYQK